MSDPSLSVILIIGDQRFRDAVALGCLLAQQNIDEIEILLLDWGAAGTPPLAGSEHPAVRTLVCERTMCLHEMKALGVREARAPIVAFLEEHVQVVPGWAEAVIAAHRGPWAGVGPAITCANPGLGISNLVTILGAFDAFSPDLPAEERYRIYGQNSAYKRRVLLDAPYPLELLLLNPLAMQRVLVEREGQRLYFQPAIQICHLNEGDTWAMMQGYFFWSRCYGFACQALLHRAWGKSLLAAGRTSLTPAIRAIRRGLSFPRSPAAKTVPGLKALFVLLLVEYSGALGQMLGLLIGLGNSGPAYTEYELNQFRPLPDGFGDV